MALSPAQLEVGLSQVQAAQTTFELGSCGVSKLPGIFPQQHT